MRSIVPEATPWQPPWGPDRGVGGYTTPQLPGAAQSPVQTWAQILMFTGFLEVDSGSKLLAEGEKQASLVDLSKQFRFPVYDSFPHSLYGNQTLAYFDPTYNLTTIDGGTTWVCDGKMFTESTASPVFGSSHIDPAVYVG